MGWIAMRPRIAFSERMREIDTQRDLDSFERIEKNEAKLLVEEIEIDGVTKFRAGLELLA